MQSIYDVQNFFAIYNLSCCFINNNPTPFWYLFCPEHHIGSTFNAICLLQTKTSNFLISMISTISKHLLVKLSMSKISILTYLVWFSSTSYVQNLFNLAHYHTQQCSSSLLGINLVAFAYSPVSTTLRSRKCSRR